MIRMAFMTDRAGTVGSSETGIPWVDTLPENVADAFEQVLYSENIVMSRATLVNCRYAIAFYDTWILTRDEEARIPSCSSRCSDYRALVQRFERSADELLVIGGPTLLELFLPYASVLDVVESSERLPGDTFFDVWNDGTFNLSSARVKEGVRLLHYQRTDTVTGELFDVS